MLKNRIKLVDVGLQRLQQKRRNFTKQYTLKVLAVKYIPVIILLCFSKFLFAGLYWLLCTILYDHRKIYGFSPVVRVWFGVPGSGKTSMASLLSRFSQKENYRVLSNFELKGAYKVTADDLGNYDMSFNGDGCHCILDEASSDFDNRNFKAFAKSNAKDYFSFHRHQNNMVDVFSQGYDIDKRIRDRTSASGLFHISKFLPGFIMYRQIGKILFIKKDDKQIIDGFKYRGLPRIIYSRSVWNDFNTLDMSHCPKAQKEWELWDDII